MGVQKLYEPSPTVTSMLYVGLAANVLGRVPWMPLFLLGNSIPTIPHQLLQHRSARFPHGLADAADESGKKGSNFYEINQWLWQFWRGKPRLGGLSVAETEEWRMVRRGQGNGWCEEGRARRHSNAPRAAGAPGGLE